MSALRHVVCYLADKLCLVFRSCQNIGNSERKTGNKTRFLGFPLLLLFIYLLLFKYNNLGVKL